MKTKLEAFKDRSELFMWASEGKPISSDDRIYAVDQYGRYYNNEIELYLNFIGLIHEYKKVIEIETETVSQDTTVVVYEENGRILYAFGIGSSAKYITKLKLTAIIEKCKETGKIIDKKFNLEEV